MTDGEKMVWAAAFALEFQRVRNINGMIADAENVVVMMPSPSHQAAVFADAAVTAVRFGAPEGEFRNAIVERPWPPGER